MATGAWQTCGFDGCPDVSSLASLRDAHDRTLLDRHGRELGNLSAADRVPVRLADCPEYVAGAFLAIEDKRFYEHRGVDWHRVGGAVAANVRRGRIAQGFSTITMQLARSVFPDRLPVERRTLGRKLLEIRVAREIEDSFSKDEILELFLNHVYLGRSARGIGAAAREYFGTEASRLTLAQAATLAALARAPGYYDPRKRPHAAQKRRDLVLALMEQQRRVRPEHRQMAALAPMTVVVRRDPAPGTERSYAVERVRAALADRFEDSRAAGAWKIHTTIDARIQKAAEEVLASQLRDIERGRYGRFGGAPAAKGDAQATDASSSLQGAIIVMDARDGDVLAWVGGRDAKSSPFDRAADGRRQAGSALKPFVYALALENGFALSQKVEDAPLRMTLADGTLWEPRNVEGKTDGKVTMRDALVRSNNLATVRVARAVGTDEIARLVARAGIGEAEDGPALALGAVTVSPVDLVAAYSAFANGGIVVRPRFVSRVETTDGEAVWSAPVLRRRLFAPDVAYLVTDVLRDAVERGTGRAAVPRKAGLPVAGKTGTTNDVHDAWFVGYTPDIVAGIWVGFDDPRPVSGEATAGALAAPAFARLLDRIYADRPVPAPWPRPAGVSELPTDATTGLLVAEGCKARVSKPELFLADRAPAAFCPGRESAPPDGFVASLDERPRRGLLASLENAWKNVIARRSETPHEEIVVASREVPRAPVPAPGDGATPARTDEKRAPQVAGKPAASGDAKAPSTGAQVPVARGTDRTAARNVEKVTAQAEKSVPRTVPPLPAPSRRAADQEAALEDDPNIAIPVRDDEASVSGNVGGWWSLQTRIDDSSVDAYRGLRLGYRIRLEQQGSRVSGLGRKWTENGRALAGAGRTTILVDGRVQGGQLSLQFREQGTRRTSSGTLVLTRPAGSGTWSGTFRSSAADSSGSATASPLR